MFAFRYIKGIANDISGSADDEMAAAACTNWDLSLQLVSE